MYNNNNANVGAQPGGQQPAFPPQASPFGNPFYGASSGLIRGGLSAYGERILGSSSEYVQSNLFTRRYAICSWDPTNKSAELYNGHGHWTRITEPMAGKLSYKPPIYDINAPDLYIPLMAFLSYVVLAGLVLGLNGRFNPENVSWLFMKGLAGWFMQVMLLKLSLISLSSGEAPLLDVVAYAGYAFTGISLAVLGKLLWKHSYYILLPWTCLCMGVFLVKTMKRVLYAEVRSYDSSKHHVLLLLIALAQFPFFIWLGNISVHWLF
ncbi:hypothetical protein Cgig2_026154 [Carnegiea gigantea]|uniref:Uncharacterized protein n=1 Tax=Carnegiea gigantea TaxID=171969 RepID=A0A9Q1Q4E2_9CARY|nr:hypothetical protein Cgig2_026154 [Carnegiea gigantea]